MKKLKGELVFSPTDLINYMESPFASWMDRLYLEYPDQCIPDENSEVAASLQHKGIVHEVEFLETLKADGQDVIEIADDAEDAHEITIAALKAGRGIIYQGVLALGNFAGKSDFLKRVDTPSRLGQFQYEVWDTKLARKTKPYFIIQLCCYSEMLLAIQGQLPEEIAVVLGDKKIKRYRTQDYFYFYQQLKNKFLDFQGTFHRERPPADLVVPDFSRWQSHSQKLLEETDDLSRVANIRKTQIRRLQNSGIDTMGELAETQLQHVEKMEPATFQILRRQAQLQVESGKSGKTQFDVLPADADDPKRGLALLPPYSVNDVFFDMEGYPHVDEGLEYLFGVTYIDSDGVTQFKDWWAHDRLEEKLAFEQFIDWVCARRKADPTMHIFHYAVYEVTAMKRLMGRHGTRELELDFLLRNKVFVDLYQIVKQALKVGEPKYSIKNIEHLYKGSRVGGVTSAVDSLLFYERWLEERDGEHWSNSAILKEIRDYNKEDCDSTKLLCDWLRKIQEEHGFTFKVDDDKRDRSVEIPPHQKPAVDLAERLLSSIPRDRGGDVEHWRVHELLAHILQFHRREDKPVHWAKYDRQAKTEEELIDDIECLGGLRRTGRAKEELSKSNLYEYSFDPNQDTKLHIDQTCHLTHDLSRGKIKELDRERGLVAITVGATKDAPPDRINLIPDELINSSTISDSILSVVTRYAESSTLPRALSDFLYRLPPRLKHRDQGETLLSQGGDVTAGVIDLVENLDSSTLCIQGPPGCGKTRLAAHTIVHLIKNGSTVGITSNSHKAIENLLDHVGVHAQKEDVSFRGIKIGADSSKGPVFKNPDIVCVKQRQKAFNNPEAPYQLIGATAFAFASDDAVDKLDYLFVDEAGQVSVANLVGMSRATKNIILLGDQMQLEQPVQGSHPGESGQSTLEYFLGDHATVPGDKGVFLGTTWRMHSDICRLISDAVYESRLSAEPSTDQRKLILPQTGGKFLSKEAGVIYVPVEHEGNSQNSDEEAIVIKEIVGELLNCQFIPGESQPARPLTLNDILIVAPYNMQVRTIERMIAHCRVASVDKFQGQEAPVVICSMSASEGNASARGVEFLFSRNRLNVALSRAQSLAIVVASPSLVRTNCTTVEQMRLVNFFCRIVDHGSKSPFLTRV